MYENIYAHFKFKITLGTGLTVLINEKHISILISPIKASSGIGLPTAYYNYYTLRS